MHEIRSYNSHKLFFTELYRWMVISLIWLIKNGKKKKYKHGVS